MTNHSETAGYLLVGLLMAVTDNCTIATENVFDPTALLNGPTVCHQPRHTSLFLSL